MFCGNCGAENAKGAKFCKECGSPLGGENQSVKEKTGDSSAETSAIRTSAENSAGTAPKPPMPKPSAPKADAGQILEKVKALPKNLLLGAGAAVIALIVLICIAVNMGNTINLNKYVTIEADGYNGYGKARAYIDWDAIEDKYGKKVSFTGAAKSELGGLISMMSPMEAVQESVRVQLDQKSYLSNDTTITYTWEVDEELSKYVKCKLKYKEGSYKVSGLEEVGTFDAFADLTVEFSGVAPDGKVSLNYQGEEMRSSDFSCDKTSGLSNGDTVLVFIDVDRVGDYAENLGMVPQELEKEFTVEGLVSYLTKLDQVTGEAMSAMQNQATDVYQAHVAQKWGEGEELESFTYIGDYLLTDKKGSRSTNNVLYLVYKAQVRNSYANEETSYNKVNDVYWYIAFENLMVQADGSIDVDLTDYSTPSNRIKIDSGVNNSWWGTMAWSYYGYETIDALYKDAVTSNIDSYNHEDDVDVSRAPETVVEEETEAEEETEEGAEEEETAEADSEGAADGSYILADSNARLLTEDDLKALTAEECKIARNEIFARHGRKFKDEALQAHFNGCDWYEGTIEPDAFKDDVLSEIEKANRDLIVAYEAKKGYR